MEYHTNSQPDEFLKLHLGEGIRPDGRTHLEMRSAVINVGSVKTANGSSLVKLGNTVVVCGVKAELTQPHAQEPDKGIIVPNVELPAMCSPKFKPGPPCDQAQIATKFLDNLIKSTNLVVLEDLCIKNDQLAWVLYCDLVCLDYDGNITDATVIALIAALHNVKLPEVIMNPDTEDIDVVYKNMHKLNLCDAPVSTTFRVFQGSAILGDPTCMEEDVTEGQLTVVTDKQDKIIYIERPGGVALNEEQLENCLKRAVVRGFEVQSLYKAVAT